MAVVQQMREARLSAKKEKSKQLASNTDTVEDQAREACAGDSPRNKGPPALLKDSEVPTEDSKEELLMRVEEDDRVNTEKEKKRAEMLKEKYSIVYSIVDIE